MTLPILIAGAGIGGLTTALALQRAGLTVRIFEQADRIAEIGAGVSLAPNATRVLANLGILERVRALGWVPNRAAIKHYATAVDLSGFEIGITMEERWGSPYVQIHRADLHAILIDAVRGNDPSSIVLGARLDSLEQDADRVVIRTTSGPATGSCLIGADGIRSVVRSRLNPEKDPTFLGYVAWRGVVPVDRLHLPIIPDTAVYLGHRKTLLRYRVRQGNAVNIVAFARSDTWTEENWSLPADPAELHAAFNGWATEVRDLIEALCDVGPFKWGLFGREQLSSWQRGRVTLVGDAAHPMLPFLGQGAAMAIEDGMLLARSIAACPSVTEAFRRYEDARYVRTMETVKRANEQGMRLHDYPVDADTALAMPVPQDDFHEYAFDATTAEIG